jgi:hypothetical protein
MGRGLSPMQKQLLQLAVEHDGAPSFRQACAQFAYSTGIDREFIDDHLSDGGLGTLMSLAFYGSPDAKRILSIRAAVCRSLRRLEERDLVQRGAAGRWCATLDGAMLVAVEKLSVNTAALTVSEKSAVEEAAQTTEVAIGD